VALGTNSRGRRGSRDGAASDELAPFFGKAYLARINYTGPRTPTYDTLAGILRAHIASIPFESFDVLLGRPIRLDPESLQAKIVTGTAAAIVSNMVVSCTPLSKPSPARRSRRPVRTAARKRASAHVSHGYSWRCYLRDRSSPNFTWISAGDGAVDNWCSRTDGGYRGR
jgi:N-acetyltransferase